MSRGLHTACLVSVLSVASGIAHDDVYPTVDLSDRVGHPKIKHAGRVIEFQTGEHFDTSVQDTPYELRPPGVVAFWGHETCPEEYAELNWNYRAEEEFPSRTRLMVGMYNMDTAPKRSWFKFTPERDLATRFKVTSCPSVVFIPRSCDGWTKWCEKQSEEDPSITVAGCEDFVENCPNTITWDGQGELTDWLYPLIEAEGEPKVNQEFGSYAKQGAWLRLRDETTEMTHLRNNFLAQGLPAFTEKGYKVVPIPPEFKEWLYSFYERHTNGTDIRPDTPGMPPRVRGPKGGFPQHRQIETWSSGRTQTNPHEVLFTQIDLDMERHEANKMCEKYVAPILEEWANVKNLELTSFYGVREYYPDNILKNHIDRIETHVISATLSLGKLDEDFNILPEDETESWPLEGVDWNGNNVRYDHPPGTMVLYESAKFVHGRPFKNPQGLHVGAFLHYRPPKTLMEWVDRSHEGEAFMEEQFEKVRYRQTETVEPAVPVYTTKRYGENVDWEEVQGIDFPVTFVNKSPSSTTVYWQGNEDPHVQCHLRWEGERCTIRTFTGHKFFFSKQMNEPQRTQGAVFFADYDSKTYEWDGRVVSKRDHKGNLRNQGHNEL